MSHYFTKDIKINATITTTLQNKFKRVDSVRRQQPEVQKVSFLTAPD